MDSPLHIDTLFAQITDTHWEERQVAGSTEQWASLSAPEVVKRTADGKAAVLLISL